MVLVATISYREFVLPRLGAVRRLTRLLDTVISGVKSLTCFAMLCHTCVRLYGRGNRVEVVTLLFNCLWYTYSLDLDMHNKRGSDALLRAREPLNVLM